MCGLLDFNDEFFVTLVIERHDDGLRRIADVPEHEFAVIVKRPHREQSRHLGSDKLPAMPPASDLLRIEFHVGDMRERDFDPALEGPEPIQSFDFEDHALAVDADFDHAAIVSR